MRPSQENIADTEIKVPTQPIVWPTDGLRRASVNSFGFGGTNSHLILDDARHYLKNHGLVWNHNCSSLPSLGDEPENETSSETNGVDVVAYDTLRDEGANGYPNSDSVVKPPKPRLLIWSASDKNALKRMVREYSTYYTSRVYGNQTKLDRLAFTLAARRSEMSWRAYAVIDHTYDARGAKTLPIKKPVRAAIKKGLAFVFTGQGAQYVKMGLELLAYPEFQAALLAADRVFKGLGCGWSVLGQFFPIKESQLLSFSC